MAISDKLYTRLRWKEGDAGSQIGCHAFQSACVLFLTDFLTEQDMVDKFLIVLEGLTELRSMKTTYAGVPGNGKAAHLIKIYCAIMLIAESQPDGTPYVTEAQANTLLGI